jgi:hypothetical protein
MAQPHVTVDCAAALIDETRSGRLPVGGPRIHSIEAIAVDIPLTRNFGGS